MTEDTDFKLIVKMLEYILSDTGKPGHGDNIPTPQKLWFLTHLAVIFSTQLYTV